MPDFSNILKKILSGITLVAGSKQKEN